MTTEVPSSYILIHEACDFLLGTCCENISADYLLTDEEQKLRSLLSEKKELLESSRAVKETLSPKYIDLELRIDTLAQYRKSLQRKLGIHDEARYHFYNFIIKSYGAMGNINSLLLTKDGTLHSFDLGSFYLSEGEYSNACKDSKGFVVLLEEDDSQSKLYTGHVILKKKNLEALRQRILDELYKSRHELEMPQGDLLEFPEYTPSKKLVEYEDLPNFSEENKKIIMMARDEYSTLNESLKGHGEVSRLAGIIKDEKAQNHTPISKKEESVAAFLKKNRQYWQ